MISRWQWLLLLFARKLWLRVTLFGAGGVATAVAGIFLAPYIPEEWTFKIGAKAIDGILDVLASSMLAVTVFSISTMVAAYGAASTNVTPRATKLLMEDNTSKNVLGTFIGSFLFSLVGLIALSTGAYGDQGRAILLVVTIGLVALIAVTILRWIDYLAGFGRLGETVGRVEDATWSAMKMRLRSPHLGGRPLDDRADGLPDSAWPVFSEAIGYVQHVDVPALEDCATVADCEIFVTALPGVFADPARPVAMMSGPAAEETKKAIAKAFIVGAERTFDQDPRFGLCVLAEIASRALSPAVNDPGTAIDVLGRVVRLLVQWGRFDRGEQDTKIAYPHVWVPAVRIDDMFDDVFAPIARDSSGIIEIQVRLQKAFLALLATDREMFSEAARRHSAAALMRADAAPMAEQEKHVVRRLAARIAAGASQLPGTG
jgi:uncharacterized membrane protein